MMHGGKVVPGARHRMHFDRHHRTELWKLEIDGHTAVMCPTDSNVKYVYYRGHWFHLVVDEFVTFGDDTQETLFERFNVTVAEELLKYIKENHICFDEEGSDGNVHSTKPESETD